MLRKLFCIGLLSLVGSTLGCAICCSPDDYNYGAYGGRWQRHDPASGRVGSAFAEAGYDSLSEARAEEPALLPGDDNIHTVSYEEANYELEESVSTYIE